jgi:hypothetical protein
MINSVEVFSLSDYLWLTVGIDHHDRRPVSDELH